MSTMSYEIYHDSNTVHLCVDINKLTFTDLLHLINDLKESTQNKIDISTIKYKNKLINLKYVREYNNCMTKKQIKETVLNHYIIHHIENIDIKKQLEVYFDIIKNMVIKNEHQIYIYIDANNENMVTDIGNGITWYHTSRDILTTAVKRSMIYMLCKLLGFYFETKYEKSFNKFIQTGLCSHCEHEYKPQYRQFVNFPPKWEKHQCDEWEGNPDIGDFGYCSEHIIPWMYKIGVTIYNTQK